METCISWIADRFHGVEARELIEAIIGLKVSRLHMKRRQLDDLDLAATTFGFGLSVASFKHHLQCDYGTWSDRISHTIPITSSDGLYVVYVASSLQLAEQARTNDAENNHIDFGHLLGIPPCCSTKFSQYWRRSSSEFKAGSYLLSSHKQASVLRVDERNNVFGQIFGHCLVSYFPCTLICEATQNRVDEVRNLLRRRAAKLEALCSAGHKIGYVTFYDGSVFKADQIIQTGDTTLINWKRNSENFELRVFSGAPVVELSKCQLSVDWQKTTPSKLGIMNVVLPFQLAARHAS